MADPESSLYIPHIMGITLDSNGVARTNVVAVNRRTGERQIIRTDANKVVIFDAANPHFSLGYLADDVIEFTNVGASVGVGTITISDATGGFQSIEITCAAAATISVGL